MTYAKGVAAASIAAGPLFALPPLLTLTLSGPRPVPEQMAVAPLVLAVALPFGFALSLIPNLLGAALLAGLGRGNVGLRLWPAWALAGAGAGWALDWATALITVSPKPIPMFALIGLPCALICRWGTRWAD